MFPAGVPGGTGSDIRLQSIPAASKILPLHSIAVISNAMVREAREGDLRELLELYQYLHEKEVPGPSRQLSAAWRKILEDPDHHLLSAGIVVDHELVGSFGLVDINKMFTQGQIFILEQIRDIFQIAYHNSKDIQNLSKRQ